MGAKEEVRARLPIAELIGEYVRLAPAGQGRLKGLCPFHKEKSPSFQVDTVQGYFYCFGCKAGGDAFNFLMRVENLSFGDALRKLAERTGVQMEAVYGERQSRDLYDVNAFALEYFRESLAGPGLEYFTRRGLTRATLDAFELGYAPEGWDGLLKRGRARGFSDRQLMDAGLLSENTESGRVYDRFRGRVMFPIRDHLGRLVGFGGRVLGDEKPKYLNTPETEVFKKSELLYGLDKARVPAQKGGELVVVEGYMDVIAMHQHGFSTAVATLGTALTAEHATLLSRQGIARLALMFDRDEAGQKATLAGLDQVIGASFDVRAVTVPDGKDPADALAGGDTRAIQHALTHGLDEVEVRVASVLDRHDLSSTEGKRAVLMALLPRMQYQELGSGPEGVALKLRRIVAERLDMNEVRLAEWIESKAKRKTLTETHLAGMSTRSHEEDQEMALLKQVLLAPDLMAKLDGLTPWRNETVKKVMLAARGARSPEDILELFRGQPEEQLLIRLMFEGRDGGALSREASQQYDQKVTSYAAAAVDDIQFKLTVGQMQEEIAALKKQLLAVKGAEQLGVLKQIQDLQRAVEAEKRSRKMEA